MSINERVRRLLEDEEEPFCTRSVDVDDFIPPEGRARTVPQSWTDCTEKDCTITWNLATEFSRWGVSDLRPRILKIDCTWTETTYVGDEDETSVDREFHWSSDQRPSYPAVAEPAAFDLDSAMAAPAMATNLSFPLNVQAVFSYKHELDPEYLTICPTSVELDLQRKSARIYFS